jgi:hypothetical protein
VVSAIYDREGQLGCSRSDNNISSSADDVVFAVLFGHRDKCNVVHEVNVYEELNFPFGKGALIPFPYQIDFAMYGNDVMDLTSAGLRSM